MFKLETDDYCEGCPYFEPKVIRKNFDDGPYVINIDTTIRCIHRHICRRVADKTKGAN